jgi:serine protease Do
MDSRPRNALTVLTAVIVFGGILLLSQSDVLTRISFAAEKGRIQADREELARLGHLADLSRAFRLVAREVGPAVVNIDTTSGQERLTEEQLEDLPEAWRRMFRDHPLPQDRGLGSGMVVKGDAGLILTNFHVVEDAEMVLVTLKDGQRFEAELVSSDPKTDLAVIRIDADHLHDVRFGDSDAMEVGDFVLAIGSPLGYESTMSHGIISAKGRSTRTGMTIYENFIQTDASINPGNSGGPLVNLNGEVVGMNTAIATRTGVNNGVGFAIPANRITRLLPYLLTGEEIVRGYLGVMIQSVREHREEAAALGWDGGYGVLVSALVPDGPGEQGGLQPEDIILTIDGKEMRSSEHLQDTIAYMPPGTKAAVEVWRGGDRQQLELEIGRQPEDFVTRAPAFPLLGPEPPVEEGFALGDLGLTVRTLDSELAERYGWPEERTGVVVVEVTPGGPAAEEGLQVGDLIAELQGEEVVSAARLAREVESRLENDQGVRLYVRSHEGNRHVLLDRQQ